MKLSEVYKERLWTKDFINTSLVNFALMMSQYLLLVTMAMYAAQQYNASVGMAGLVSSSFIIGSLIGRLFGGKHITENADYRFRADSYFNGLILNSYGNISVYSPQNTAWCSDGICNDSNRNDYCTNYSAEQKW